MSLTHLLGPRSLEMRQAPVILADLGACRSRTNNFRDEDNPGNLSVPSTAPVWVRMQAVDRMAPVTTRSLYAPRLALRQDSTELSSFWHRGMKVDPARWAIRATEDRDVRRVCVRRPW